MPASAISGRQPRRARAIGALDRSCRRAPADPLARCPRRQPRHASQDLHRRAEHHSGSTSPTPQSRSSARSAPTGSTHGLHFHIGSQILDLRRFAPRWRRRAAGRFQHPQHEAAAPAARLTPTSSPRRRSRTTSSARTRPCARSGDGKRIDDELGRARAQSTVTLYTVESSQAQRGGLRRGRRRQVGQPGVRCSTTPATRRDGGRARTPTPRTRRLVHPAGTAPRASDIITADVDLPTPRPGDIVAVPVTGAYGHAMANNYNLVSPGRRSSSSAMEGAAAVRRESHEDLTWRIVRPRPTRSARPARPRHRRRRVRRPRRRARRPRRHDRHRPAASEATGVLRRNEGDFGDILNNPDLVVELMGGLEPAREYVVRADGRQRTPSPPTSSCWPSTARSCGTARASTARSRASRPRPAAPSPSPGSAAMLAGAHVERLHGIAQRHHELHLEPDGRDRRRVRRTRPPRPRRSGTPRPTDRRRHRQGRRAKMAILARWRSTRREPRRDPHEGIEHLTADDLEYARSSASASS